MKPVWKEKEPYSFHCNIDEGLMYIVYHGIIWHPKTSLGPYYTSICMFFYVWFCMKLMGKKHGMLYYMLFSPRNIASTIKSTVQNMWFRFSKPLSERKISADFIGMLQVSKSTAAFYVADLQQSDSTYLRTESCTWLPCGPTVTNIANFAYFQGKWKQNIKNKEKMKTAMFKWNSKLQNSLTRHQSYCTWESGLFELIFLRCFVVYKWEIT